MIASNIVIFPSMLLGTRASGYLDKWLPLSIQISSKHGVRYSLTNFHDLWEHKYIEYPPTTPKPLVYLVKRFGHD
jgi:hypothetical protein